MDMWWWQWLKENNRNVLAVVVMEGKQQKCGGGGGANNSTRPYLYEIPAHFCHELKTKSYDVIGVNFYPRQTNEIPLKKTDNSVPTILLTRSDSSQLCCVALI